MNCRPKKHRWCFTVLITILSALGGFLFGYDTGVISGALIQLRNYFHLTYIYQELIVSISLIAAVLASVFSAFLNDRFGRKAVILIASALFTIGAIVMGSAYTKYTLLVGRLIVGLGIGVASTTVPIYIAEISPTQWRGALVTVNVLFITAGQVIAAVVDGIFMFDSNRGWRYMLGLGAVPSAIQFVAFLGMPESPRWLIQHGRISEACKTLQRIHGQSSLTPEIRDEIKNMVDASKNTGISSVPHNKSFEVLEEDLDANQNFSGDPVVSGTSSVGVESSPGTDSIQYESGLYGYWSRLKLIRMLRYAPTRRALVIGCGLQIFQQLVGINTVMYYSASIISMAGLGSSTNGSQEQKNSHIVWLAALVAFSNFFFSLLAPWIITRFKRRTVLFCSLTGIIASLIILGTSFTLIASNSSPVTVFEPVPINSISPQTCLKAKTCDQCMRTSACAFCYQLDGTKVVNGSCLPSPDAFSDYSTYGRCANNSHVKAIWAYDHCPTSLGWLTVTGLILYLASFAPGMSPIPWAINSEIYPTWARSTGAAVATACNWITNVLVSLTFLSLTEAITRQGTYFLYAGIASVAIVFVYFMVPEIGNQSLEQIELTLAAP